MANRFTSSLVVLAVLVYITSTQVQSFDTTGPGIRNATVTTIEQHPYYVSVESLSGTHICDGALINENTVVTSAQCLLFYELDQVAVRVGANDYSNGGQVIALSAESPNPNFDFFTTENDISLLRLAQSVEESATVGFIALASQQPASGEQGVVVGLGINQSLVEFDASVISYEDCLASDYGYDDELIFKTNICVQPSPKYICNGEPGSPLVVDSELAGFVSWGNDCSNKGNPAVYTDISSFNSWIEKALKEL